VQTLLERHFAGDMGFVPDSIAPKRELFSTDLLEAIDAYFAYPHPQDEPPPINGDPITDAQEYPILFSVGRGEQHGDNAIVPVRYDDGYRARHVRFLLRREADAWRVDDAHFEDDRRWREDLALPPAD
jgi:hypothetical protein